MQLSYDLTTLLTTPIDPISFIGRWYFSISVLTLRTVNPHSSKRPNICKPHHSMTHQYAEQNINPKLLLIKLSSAYKVSFTHGFLRMVMSWDMSKVINNKFSFQTTQNSPINSLSGTKCMMYFKNQLNILNLNVMPFTCRTP